MVKLILLGGGGHAISCIEAIESTRKFKIVGVLDNDPKCLAVGLGFKYLGLEQSLSNEFWVGKNVHISIGQIKSPKTRVKLYQKLKDFGAKFPIIIANTSYVSKTAHIDEGTIMLNNCTVNHSASIGKNCIINSTALIEHGVNIEDNCHVSTGAIVNGDAIVKSNTFIGSGAIIKEGIKIGSNCIIQMGAQVFNDVENNSVIKNGSI